MPHVQDELLAHPYKDIIKYLSNNDLVGGNTAGVIHTCLVVLPFPLFERGGGDPMLLGVQVEEAVIGEASGQSLAHLPGRLLETVSWRHF